MSAELASDVAGMGERHRCEATTNQHVADNANAAPLRLSLITFRHTIAMLSPSPPVVMLSMLLSILLPILALAHQDLRIDSI